MADQSTTEAELARIRRAYATTAYEVDQILGKALGYSAYGPDMFPDGKPNGDVCTGDHVPESIAAEAADKIRTLAQDLADATTRRVAAEMLLRRDHVAIMAIHVPRCHRCFERQCTCVTASWLDEEDRHPDWRCPICVESWGDERTQDWPCPTVQALGRVAWCEGITWTEEMAEVLCDGVLVFGLDDLQAACLTCGASCGAMVAAYVDQHPDGRPA